MHCPTLSELPPPPLGKTGWPWTEESEQLPDTMPSGEPWPRVSIVTPSYNQGQFIEESIRSVLLQGYPNLEYIIIDGGSTDGSVEIIRKYEPWLAYWVSESDRGQSHAINKGLERSTGQLFNWHNSDDVLTPNSLATTVAAMMNYPDASCVHGYSIVIDSQSHILFHNHPILTETGVVLDRAWSVSNLKCGGQPGCLMDRDLVVELGGVDENLHYAMDLDLTLKLALVRPPLYVDHPVVYFRVHPNSKSRSMYEMRAKDRLIIAQRLFDQPDLPPAIKILRRKAFATAHQFAWRSYAEVKMYRHALWHVLQDIFYSPRENWRARGAILYKAARQIFFGFRKAMSSPRELLRQVRRQLRRSWEVLQFHRYRNKLKDHLAPTSRTCEEYLETQLRRTLFKANYPLPVYARRLIDKTAELVDLTHSDVLCVGCRNVAELDYFRDKGAKSVIGIDLYSQREDILVMDMHAMTFEADHFDLIFSSHSLEHALNLEQVTGEFIRTVRDGGIIVVEVPVHYDVGRTDTDLIDFGSLDNLHRNFEPYVDQILWSETSQAGAFGDELETDAIRTIIRVRKQGLIT